MNQTVLDVILTKGKTSLNQLIKLDLDQLSIEELKELPEEMQYFGGVDWAKKKMSPEQYREDDKSIKGIQEKVDQELKLSSKGTWIQRELKD